MKSEAMLMDCMEYMRSVPDKYFDLAVVDPPYGINFSDYERVSSGIKVKERYTKNGKKKWDNEIPPDEYFAELFRISQNYIIWGANYFNLPPTQGFIFWHKQNPVPNFADGELAYTSFKTPAKCFNYRYYGNINRDVVQIHPTQKPIALYSWIYHNYLPDGGKVFDSHLGSGSNRIAADKAGNIDFYATEIDKDYFDAQEKRWKDYKSQLTLF